MGGNSTTSHPIVGAVVVVEIRSTQIVAIQTIGSRQEQALIVLIMVYQQNRPKTFLGCSQAITCDELGSPDTPAFAEPDRILPII